MVKTNCATLFCKVVEVLHDFLSEYVQKKFTTDIQCSISCRMYWHSSHFWDMEPKVVLYTEKRTSSASTPYTIHLKSSIVCSGHAPVAITKNVA